MLAHYCYSCGRNTGGGPYLHQHGKYYCQLCWLLGIGSKKGAQSMPIKCRIYWDIATGSYVVSSPYSEKFVNGMKYVIPSGDREYDGQTKLWYVKEAYGEALKNVAETMFGVGTVSFTSKTVAEQARTQQSYVPPPVTGVILNNTDRNIIAFFKLLPYEGAKTAYLKAAQALHPDKNGGVASEKMVELNQLWSQIEREVYKR
jgi:hypothetical protein